MNYRGVSAAVPLTDRVFYWRFRVRQNDALARRGCPFVIWLTKVMLGTRTLCINAHGESYQKHYGTYGTDDDLVHLSSSQELSGVLKYVAI
jgi:hypothetical protein